MKTVVAGVVFLCLLFGAAVVGAAEFEIFAKSSYMNWTENYPLSGRNPFVEESGVLPSLGGGVSFHPTKNISSKLELEIFGGMIDYRGGYIADQSPYNTTKSRYGFSVEWETGYKALEVGEFRVTSFFSLVATYFHREVCAEDWYIFHSRVGIQADYGMFFFRVGAFVPIYTEMRAGLVNVPWINEGRETFFTLNPKETITPFAEIGMKKGKSR